VLTIRSRFYALPINDFRNNDLSQRATVSDRPPVSAVGPQVLRKAVPIVSGVGKLRRAA